MSLHSLGGITIDLPQHQCKYTAMIGGATRFLLVTQLRKG
jgi:hypothetical protein